MFKKDNIATGLILGIGSTILLLGIIYVILGIAGIEKSGNLRFFLLAFIPNIIFIRYYLKNLHYHKTAYTLIVITFVFMISFLVYLMRSGEINI